MVCQCDWATWARYLVLPEVRVLHTHRVWVIGALVSGATWNKQEILFNGAGVVVFSDIVCVDRNYASVCSSPLDCVCACVCV